jgi:cytochrome b561
MATTNSPTQFALLSRILHWLMAAMLLTMLFIGVSMISSLGNYHRLVVIHRPLGIMILILAVIRLAGRMFTTPPPFPPTMSRAERFAATTSETLLYTLCSPCHWWVGVCCQPAIIESFCTDLCICRRFSRQTRHSTLCCANRTPCSRISCS